SISIAEIIASYFWVGSISYNSWMLNRLGCRIMVMGSTPPVFWLVFVQLPLYKIWGGTSFFVLWHPCPARDGNYEIHSIYKLFNFFDNMMTMSGNRCKGTAFQACFC